jgi:hypothetical protein
VNARADLPAGIHSIDADAYHADPCPQPSLSNSLISTLLKKTPRHAWMEHPRLNPMWEPAPGIATFDIGTAAHSLLLEGISKAVRIDADDWRTNAAKEAREAARADGLIPLLPNQYEAVMAMVDAAHCYIGTTSLSGIFDRDRGMAEQTIIWRDSHVWCRARPDWITDDYSLILDYKSTGAEGPGEFMRRNIVAHGYDTQSVWYPRGLAAVGHRNARFLFLVQETFAPFMCYLVEPAESMVELASNKIARALPLWRDCLHRNQWPGYSTNVHQAEAPVWALKEEESIA